MEDTTGEEAAFVADDVSNIIKESIDSVLQNQQYNESKVSQWTSTCLEQCIKKLTALNKPFKYVVTCVIMQKNVVMDSKDPVPIMPGNTVHLRKHL